MAKPDICMGSIPKTHSITVHTFVWDTSSSTSIRRITVCVPNPPVTIMTSNLATVNAFVSGMQEDVCHRNYYTAIIAVAA